MNTLHHLFRLGAAAAVLTAPTTALALDAETPLPCDELPNGCPGSPTYVVFGAPVGFIPTSASRDIEDVGGGYTVNISGREREIDQFAPMFKLWSSGSGEQVIYGYSHDALNRRTRRFEKVYQKLLTHVEFLPSGPTPREVVDADLDGDGTLDLVVGDPYGSCGSGNTGRLLVYYDISEEHDARFPESIICGVPYQYLGNPVNSNRLTGAPGLVSIPDGPVTYLIDDLGYGKFVWISSYPTQ